MWIVQRVSKDTFFTSLKKKIINFNHFQESSFDIISDKVNENALRVRN